MEEAGTTTAAAMTGTFTIPEALRSGGATPASVDLAGSVAGEAGEDPGGPGAVIYVPPC